MRSFTTRFSSVLIIVTIFLQVLVAKVGSNINNNRRNELSELQTRATYQWMATATYIAGYPSFATPPFSITPVIPTPTPLSCLVNVSDPKGLMVYALPVQGLSVDSILVNQGESLTLIGKLKDEPWWRAYYPDSSDTGWIQDGKLDKVPECSIVDEVDLSFLLNNKDDYKIIIQDTFNGFDNDWRNTEGLPNERPATNGIAQLHLNDRSSSQNSEEVAHLDNLGVQAPFEFVASVSPFSFSDTSYIGYRYKSASNPDDSWIEFKLVRKYCTVEWRYSIKGEITKNPPFTLGESAGCSNDKVSDYFKVKMTYDLDTNAVRFFGNYNDIALPSLSIFDREKILELGSFELIASKSDVLFDFILVYRLK